MTARAADAPRPPGPAVAAPAGRRAAGWIGASLALHGAALAAMLLPAPQPRPAPVAEQGVTLVWDRPEEGAGDVADAGPLPAPPPDLPPAPPLPQAPPQPPVAAAPPQPAAPLPPAVLAAAMPAAMPAAPGASPPDPLPAPPAMLPPNTLAALPPPTRPPGPAEAPPVAGPAAPIPPPPAEPPPRPSATPRPRAPAPPRPAAPAPAGTAPAEAVWSPPQAAGAALALGAVSQARPLGGAVNPAPEYPHASRLRGEQGRVTLLVRVDGEGRVAEVSLLATSGFAALDRSAEAAVRRWRFEPAMQDGRPVPAVVSVPVIFTLEGTRRW
ncbi:energy transducer TonB [Falsiroseomonas sp. CW058]|uniref:energy transducer TonB n=1 Tax=Falsiroseomonas sp. CW058 TaxID=3388664 RepID=UPI003D316689